MLRRFPLPPDLRAAVERGVPQPPAEPVTAATVMLVREPALSGTGVEVWLLRRSGRVGDAVPDLAAGHQRATADRQLARRPDHVTGAHGRLVGRQRRDDVGQLEAELREALQRTHAAQPFGRLR